MCEYQKQANNFATKVGLKMSVKYFDYGYHFQGDNQQRHIFKVTLRRNKKSYSFKFGQSIAMGSEEPTMYDVLSCLTKYDVGSFENFCGDFGYERYQNDYGTTLNKVSSKIYKAVCKEFENVDKLFNDVMDELCEIQ